MANNLLTVDQITREALRVLHQQLNFIGNINKQYDDQFQAGGAQIGDSLRIRKPPKYTVRSGKTIDVQDSTERSTTLTVDNQKGVDLEFTSKDRTLYIEDFSDRFLKPAMAALAADIESDVLSLYKDVYQQISNIGSSMTFQNVLNGRKKLNYSLTPKDNNRNVLLDEQANVDLVDALKGLFHSGDEISQQYLQGMIGRTAGFDFYENTLLPTHTSGGRGQTGYKVNGAGQTGDKLTVDTGSNSINKGDVFTISGVNKVHPETKADLNQLQQFVVTEDYSGGSGDISISPSIVTSGAEQNVTNSPADNNDLSFESSASTTYNISLAFHRDFATFATADLVMPEGMDFATRQTYDGVSMRVIRGYDINNDNFPCRIDVLYGYQILRPQLACRLASN